MIKLTKCIVKSNSVYRIHFYVAGSKHRGWSWWSKKSEWHCCSRLLLQYFNVRQVRNRFL